MQSSNLARIRLILWGLVIVVGLGASALYIFSPPERPVGLFGGSFSLQTTDGVPFTENDLKGPPTLIFFGYTFCPDVCPTTLAETTGWREQLGLTPEELRIIFVTVDPERDTAESLATYLTAFGSPVIGLRGTEEQTEKAKAAFGVFSERVEDASSTEYLVDHTASVFMIGTDGRFEGTISFGEDGKTAKGKITKLIEG